MSLLIVNVAYHDFTGDLSKKG
uniref:Uncharacterized protein n=1 Tax=Anguilla anguilla TaxID=7936 RepID=A0A0E9W2P9_ANGAN